MKSVTIVNESELLMTIIEKLKKIEPIVRHCTNGYNADIIKEAIALFEEQESSLEKAVTDWKPGERLVTDSGKPIEIVPYASEVTIESSEGEEPTTTSESD